MPQPPRRRSLKRLAITAGILLFLGLGLLLVLANFYVEPVLRKRLHTLIIEGSDSLYSYQLGDLRTNLFGGDITVRRFSLAVDSNRYAALEARGALPALVVDLKVGEAHIRGIGIFSLLFNKKILIKEIASKDANIRLLRNVARADSNDAPRNKEPLWKTLRTKINDISIERIRLDGIRLLYRNSEDIDAAKLQFDRCDALFEDIRVDSAAVADTTRIGYVKDFSFKLHDLKFRTADSAYKLKTEWITYSSAERRLQVDSFKLQPTLKKDERFDSTQRSWYTVTFDKVDFRGLRLDRYLRFNRAEADSVLFQNPRLSIYQDKAAQKTYRSKIGGYPHQALLKAKARIAIKKFVAHNLQIDVTEKHPVTREEGTITLSELEVSAQNIVNDPVLVRQNPVSTATGRGRLLGSPIAADFRFYLDSAEGRFDVRGRIDGVAAAQINPVSTRLANIEVPSVQIDALQFFVRGEDFGATADVQMRYRNLSLILRKRDEETGSNSTQKFLTNLLNRYAIHSSNPAGGAERTATGVKTARLTTQTFFGIIWKAVFEGMQRIMLKGG